MIISRREIRIILVQTLFEADFNNISIENNNLLDIYNRISSESDRTLEDNPFAVDILKGLTSHQKEIDEILDKVAINWPLDKIGRLDKSILRLGTYEILNGKKLEVPGRVALNEMVELSKLFLDENSKKFINGVLGTIYNEVKDPKEEEYVSSRMTEQTSIGGIVFNRNEKTGELKFIFIFDIFGKWTVSKGKLEENETHEDGVKRVLKTELDLDVIPSEKISSNEYVAHKEDETIKKKVTYYLAETKTLEFKLKELGGLKEANWFTEEESKKLKFYSDMKNIIFDGISKVKGKYGEQK